MKNNLGLFCHYFYYKHWIKLSQDGSFLKQIMPTHRCWFLIRHWWLPLISVASVAPMWTSQSAPKGCYALVFTPLCHECMHVDLDIVIVSVVATLSVVATWENSLHGYIFSFNPFHRFLGFCCIPYMSLSFVSVLNIDTPQAWKHIWVGNELHILYLGWSVDIERCNLLEEF